MQQNIFFDGGKMTQSCSPESNILRYLQLINAVYMRIIQKVNIFCLLGCIFYCSSLSSQGIKFNDGEWIRVRITADGVYKITGSDLKNAGLNLTGKNPVNLSVFTHQGAMLPELSRRAFHGTREIPVFVEDGSDGIFGSDDYVIFYAAAPHTWSFSAGQWRHQTHFYVDYTYLYVGFGSVPGKRIINSSFQGAPDIVVDKSEWMIFHEKDLENPIHMGRTWLGEKMGNETLNRNIDLSLPASADDTVSVRVSVAGGMQDGSGSVTYNINNLTGTISYTPINTEYVAFDLQERFFQISAPDKKIQAQFSLSRPNAKSSGWINFMEVSGKMHVNTAQGPVVIRNRDFKDNITAEIRITTDLMNKPQSLWNVSDPFMPVAHNIVQVGNFKKALSGPGESKKMFVAFEAANIPKPEILGIITGPNLLVSNPPEMLIITHRDFLSAANRLAEIRRKNQGYNVQVTDVADIYKQFSTSQQDIVAIRDFVRLVYLNSLNAGKPLKYVLLMGAASYDMKDRVKGNTNFIPTYQYDAHNKGVTFCLDDFYGYLDSLSGDPGRSKNHMWVSLGRIPCRSAAEAEGMVSKLERYDSPGSLGDWRTNITFVTDDVDISWETVFTSESERYAQYIDTVHPYLSVTKIFSDAFKQVSTGNTEKYPEVNQAIDRTIKDGCLFMNYQGHGGPAGWAQEAVLDVPMIKAWNNRWKMPVMFTATCEFSLYDDPSEQSAGELALLNPNGGPIALMSTTRLVFVSGNMAINNDFWTNYGFPKPNEPIPTLGDVFRRLKNRQDVTSEDNKFALLGDPSMPLAFPKHTVVLDSINHKSAAGFDDTLKAFGVVEIKGHIEERLKGKFTGFNGNLWVKVLDKPTLRKTLVNDQLGAPIPYEDQSSYIFKGTVSVQNGEFKIVFATPKDIAYQVDFGKILLYAHNGETDAAGGFKVKIGGSEPDVTPGTDGPLVRVYMNDTTFVSGGQVQPKTELLVKVYDTDGLNATGAGIGRDMLAIVDKGTPDEKSFLLNEYFSYDLNSYRSGSIRMPLINLAPGKHTVLVKVWDIFNNSGQGSTEFTVGEGKLEVTDHAAFPNPFSNSVALRFTHNMPSKDITADVAVIDMTGKILHKYQKDIPAAATTEVRLTWTGFSSPEPELRTAELLSGVYQYRVHLKCGQASTSFSGKMIKIVP